MNETKSQAQGESPHTGQTLRSVAPYVILLVVAFSVYLNALKNDFVWDDDILIVENHLIRSWSHLPKLLSQSLFQLEAEGILGGRYYRPLVSLSYVIDYSLWGLNPAGYHLTNILFHCLNVLLLFHLSVRILGDRTTGFIASLLFAANPVNSHVVTFIATRSDLFAFLFFILSLLMYHMYRRPIGDAKPRFYIGALVFFCLSLLCKEIALTLPPIVFLHDLCLTDRFRKDGFAWKSFVIYVPFAAILVGYFSLRQLAISGGLEFAIYSLSDLIYRISTIIVSIPLYWEQLLFPTGLSYDRTVDVVSSLTSPSFLGSLAIVSAFLILTVYWWRKDKRLFFCSAWFFIVFAPASNLLPIFPSLAATTLYIPIHFIYLPSIGLYFIAASAIAYGIRGAGADGTGRWKRRLSLLLVPLIIFELSVLTIRRNTDWRNNQTLYESSLAANPNSVRIMNNLGIVYMKQKQYRKALELFESALRLQPDHVAGYNNIAVISEDLGFKDRAEQNYRKALSYDEKNIRAGLGLGKLLAETGRIDEAKKQFALLVQWYPTLSAAHHELGRLHSAQGLYGDAIAEFEAALENTPNPDTVYNSLGIVYANQGRLKQASEYFARALKANPESYMAHVNLGNIYFVHGLREEAIKEYEDALKSGANLPAIQQRVSELRRQRSEGE